LIGIKPGIQKCISDADVIKEKSE